MTNSATFRSRSRGGRAGRAAGRQGPSPERGGESGRPRQTSVSRSALDPRAALRSWQCRRRRRLAPSSWPAGPSSWREATSGGQDKERGELGTPSLAQASGGWTLALFLRPPLWLLQAPAPRPPLRSAPPRWKLAALPNPVLGAASRSLSSSPAANSSFGSRQGSGRHGRAWPGELLGPKRARPGSAAAYVALPRQPRATLGRRTPSYTCPKVGLGTAAAARLAALEPPAPRPGSLPAGTHRGLPPPTTTQRFCRAAAAAAWLTSGLPGSWRLAFPQDSRDGCGELLASLARPSF